MARIRTIKPEFFRHEALQDLEIANPGKYPMMVYEALWGHCDSKGRFEWKPRMLKLDILPFLPFDMAETLGILEKSGMIRRYSIDGKEYGEVPTFDKHQRLTGKELQDGVKHPEPTSESLEKYRGSIGEIPESQEGKGREEEGKRKGVNPPSLRDAPPEGSVKSKSITFGQWRTEIKAKGERAVSEYKTVWTYAKDIGIPEDWIQIAWLAFVARYTADEKAKKKRYIDWRGVFLRAVKENWFGLWFYSERDQSFCLTTKGVAADLETREKAAA